jgi:hypothetical protein
VRMTGALALTSGAWATVGWDAEDYDYPNWHDNVTNNSRITVPLTGVYMAYFYWRLATTASTGRIHARLLQNGSEILKNSTVKSDAANEEWGGTMVSWPLLLPGGSYLQVEIFQALAALNLMTISRFGVVRIR